MKPYKSLALLLFVVACLCLPARSSAAQHSNLAEKKKKNPTESVYLYLLARKDVQAELKIDEAEMAELAMTVDIYMSGGGSGVVDTAAGMWQADSKLIDELSGVLQNDQLTRLKQLVVRFLGLESLYSSETEKAIGLSANQEVEVETILNDLFNKRIAATKSINDPALLQRTLYELDAKADSEILPLLSEQQIARLKALGGPAFTEATSGT